MVIRCTTGFNIKRVHEFRTEFDYMFLCIFVSAPSLCRQAIPFNWIHFSACITFIPSVSSAPVYRDMQHSSAGYSAPSVAHSLYLLSLPPLIIEKQRSSTEYSAPHLFHVLSICYFTHPLYIQATCFCWIFCPTCVTILPRVSSAPVYTDMQHS